jgi:hypothetical protein
VRFAANPLPSLPTLMEPGNDPGQVNTVLRQYGLIFYLTATMIKRRVSNSSKLAS